MCNDIDMLFKVNKNLLLDAERLTESIAKLEKRIALVKVTAYSPTPDQCDQDPLDNCLEYQSTERDCGHLQRH